MSGIYFELATETKEKAEFQDICELLFNYVVAISPVDTGYFASQWEIDFNYPTCYISNDTPYGEFLDEGWSKQAPDGIKKPAKKYLKQIAPESDFYDA